MLACCVDYNKVPWLGWIQFQNTNKLVLNGAKANSTPTITLTLKLNWVMWSGTFASVRPCPSSWWYNSKNIEIYTLKQTSPPPPCLSFLWWRFLLHTWIKKKAACHHQITTHKQTRLVLFIKPVDFVLNSISIYCMLYITFKIQLCWSSLSILSFSPHFSM